MELKLQKTLRDCFGKSIETASKAEVYSALPQITKNEMKNRPRILGERKLYYVSAKFLVGKLLSNNLINLELFDETREMLTQYGMNLAEIEEEERETSWGNGGLGRLAACFLDSIAVLNLCRYGTGLNYHDGLFYQKLVNDHQQEEADPWITEDRWLRRTNVHFPVRLGDHTVTSSIE